MGSTELFHVYKSASRSSRDTLRGETLRQELKKIRENSSPSEDLELIIKPVAEKGGQRMKAALRRIPSRGDLQDLQEKLESVPMLSVKNRSIMRTKGSSTSHRRHGGDQSAEKCVYSPLH